MFLTINKVKPHRLNKLKKKRTWDKKKILIEMDVYKRRQTERNLFSRVVRDTKPKTKTEKKKLRSITISVIQCVKRQVYVIAKVVKICWKGKMLKVHSVIYLKVVIISDFLISN